MLSFGFKKETITKHFILECRPSEFCSKWSSREHSKTSISWDSNGETFISTENANIHCFCSQVNALYFVAPYIQ